MNKTEVLKKYHISEATLHNWKKLKYINSLENISVEEIEEILKKKKGIRRNKKNSSNNIIPYSYVSDKNIIDIIEKILNIKSLYNISIEEILYETIIKLLNETNYDIINDMEKILGQRSKNENFINEFNSIKIKYKDDNDFLGCLYMSLLSVGKKDTNGIFYTPYTVVNKIIKSINFDSNQYIVDPGCGSGNFLIQVFKKLKAKKIDSTKIVKNLFGFDIDPIACLLSKINIYIQDNSISYNNINIYTIDFLTDNWNKKFDVIIGNPPWGKKYTSDEKKKIENKYDKHFSKLDSFSQFILKSISLLNDNGVLSFVLPSSILNISAHESIRKELLKYKIEYINRIGREFEEIVTDVIIIKLYKAPGNNNICKYDNKKVSQKSFETNKYSNFLISDKIATSIISKLKKEKHFHLNNDVNYALGIVTGNNKNYLYDTQVKNSEPIISGKELSKYNINYSSIQKYIIFNKDKFQQVANEQFYRCKNKIIYKFIGKKLCFCVENKGLLTLNSANIICLNDKYNQYYISAILNSRITQLYFDETYNTYKVLRNHIESFYIPILKNEIEKSIEVLSKKSKPSNKYNEDIEKIIYENLNLSIEEIYYLKGRYN